MSSVVQLWWKLWLGERNDKDVEWSVRAGICVLACASRRVRAGLCAQDDKDVVAEWSVQAGVCALDDKDVVTDEWSVRAGVCGWDEKDVVGKWCVRAGVYNTKPDELILRHKLIQLGWRKNRLLEPISKQWQSVVTDVSVLTNWKTVSLMEYLELASLFWADPDFFWA